MASDPTHFDPQPWDSDVALFIDWQHFKPSVLRRGLAPDPLLLIDAASRYGRLVVARAFADWRASAPQDRHDPAHMSEAGIEPVFVPPGSDAEGRHRLNSTVVKLSTDCLETSFINSHISTYVLVTGGYRYPYLTQSLRKRGYRVVLIGLYRQPPRAATDRVDEVLHYERLIEQSRPAEPSPDRGPAEEFDRIVGSLIQLVREQRENGRYPLLSWLGHQLRRRFDGFNPQVYGFDKFKDLVHYVEHEGHLRIATQGLLDWALLPEDDLPVAQPGGGMDSLSSQNMAPGEAVSPSLVTFVSHPVLESPQPFIDYREVFEDLVRTVCEMEADPRYEFITPGFLGQSLWRRGHWESTTLPSGTSPVSSLLRELRAGQIRKLVDFALEEGLLYATAQYDPDTGKSFSTVHVRRTHSFAQSVLKHLRENATAGELPAGDPEEDGDFTGYRRTG